MFLDRTVRGKSVPSSFFLCLIIIPSGRRSNIPFKFFLMIAESVICGPDKDPFYLLGKWNQDWPSAFTI